MNQITLKNGTTIEAVQVNGQTRFVQGANRDTLEFQFPKEGNSFDNLDTHFSAANTEKLTITTDSGSFVYDSYSLRAGMGLIPVVVMPAGGTTPEQAKERYTVTMAQKTYSEIQQESLKENVAALNIAIAEMMGV